MTTTNNSPLRSAIRIFTFAQTMRGDFHATERQLAKFSTEALVDAAEIGVSNMSEAERSKFGPYERITNRESALMAICSVAHAQRMREWSAAFERSLAAARVELPSALEALGASL